MRAVVRSYPANPGHRHRATGRRDQHPSMPGRASRCPNDPSDCIGRGLFSLTDNNTPYHDTHRTAPNTLTGGQNGEQRPADGERRPLALCRYGTWPARARCPPPSASPRRSVAASLCANFTPASGKHTLDAARAVRAASNACSSPPPPPSQSPAALAQTDARWCAPSPLSAVFHKSSDGDVAT
jgi:hypothetical protein